MTADVELLPCAECGMPCRAGEYHPFAACLMFKACHNSETVRANLAPLQAENERLRAEVSELRAARIAYANEFPATEDGDPDTGNIHANIRALKARAERLAEALRLALKWAEAPPTGEPLYKESEADLAAARAALRDHDQENKA